MVDQRWEQQGCAGLIPGLGIICELSLLLVLVLAPRGFSRGSLNNSRQSLFSTLLKIKQFQIPFQDPRSISS